MENLISQLIAAQSPALVVFLAISLTFLIVKELVSAFKWVKDLFDNYHKKQNSTEEKEESVEDRLSILEKDDKWQYNKLNELSLEIKEIIKMVKDIQEVQAKTTINTHKGVIFRIYHDSMKQGYITQSELDRFMEIVKLYQDAGGDGVVDEKIYPEVLKLPIKPNTE